MLLFRVSGFDILDNKDDRLGLTLFLKIGEGHPLYIIELMSISVFPNPVPGGTPTMHILDVSLIWPIYFWSWSLY